MADRKALERIRKKYPFLLQDAVLVVLLSISVTCMLIHALNGFGINDEGFYLTLAHRLMQGDALLTQEWHVSQLCGLLLYLPFRLFYRITGSTDGILLYARLLYIAVQLGVSVFVYCKTRKRSPVSVVIGFLYCNYSSISMHSLSYFTICTFCCTVIGILLFLSEKKSTGTFVVCGALLSVAVVAQPVLAVLYIAWAAAVLIKNKKQKVTDPGSLFYIKNFLAATVVVTVLAAAVLAFVFSRSSLQNILAAIPNMLTDKEHDYGFTAYSRTIIDKYWKDLGNRGILFVGAFSVLSVIIIADKKREKNKNIYFGFLCLMYVAEVAYITVKCMNYKSAQDILLSCSRHAPIFIISPLCFLLSNKKEKKLLCFFIFSVCISLFVDLSSNASIFTGTALAVIPGWSIISNFVFEQKTQNSVRPKKANIGKNRLVAFFKTGKAMILLFVVPLVLVEIWNISFLKFNKVSEYSSGYGADMNTMLTEGPCKGIRTNAFCAGRYNNLIQDLDIIKSRIDDAPVFIPQCIFWVYLYLDLPYGSFSSWYVEDDDESRWDNYYALNPDKMPEYIYIPCYEYYGFYDITQTAEQKVRYYKQKYNCTVEKGRAGFILKVPDSERMAAQGTS